MYPRQYKYTRDHHWIDLDDEGCRIGITHHAQHLLGDVVYIALPDEGARLSAGEPFAVIEACGAILELCAPIAGEVVAVNDSLNAGPAGVNAKPHDSWIVALKPHDEATADALLDAADYVALVGCAACGS